MNLRQAHLTRYVIPAHHRQSNLARRKGQIAGAAQKGIRVGRTGEWLQHRRVVEQTQCDDIQPLGKRDLVDQRLHPNWKLPAWDDVEERRRQAQ